MAITHDEKTMFKKMVLEKELSDINYDINRKY